jgi:hypothetical protein
MRRGLFCFSFLVLFLCGLTAVSGQENTNFLQNILFGLFNNGTDDNQIGTLLNLLSLGPTGQNNTSGVTGLISSLTQLTRLFESFPDLSALLTGNNNASALGNDTTNSLNSILENLLDLLPGNAVESLLTVRFPNLSNLDDISQSELLVLVTSVVLQASGVGETCRNDVGTILAGIMESSDWAIRSKYIS